MVETRSQRACCILRDTIGLDADSPLEKALFKANLLTMESWLYLDEKEVDCLSYDEDGKSIELDDRNKIKFTAFITLVQSKSRQSLTPSVLDGSALTHEEFVDVLTSSDFLNVVLKDSNGISSNADFESNDDSFMSDSSYRHNNELGQVDCSIIDCSASLQTSQRILRHVMDLGDDSPLEKALTEASLMDHRMWFYLSREQINALSYTDNGKLETLRLGDTVYLEAFIAFVDLKRKESSDQLHYDGSTLTAEEYDQFLGSCEFRHYRRAGMQIATAGCEMPAAWKVKFNNSPSCAEASADVDDGFVVTAHAAVLDIDINKEVDAVNVLLLSPKRADNDFEGYKSDDNGELICGDIDDDEDWINMMNTTSTSVYHYPVSFYGRQYLAANPQASRNGMANSLSNRTKIDGRSTKEHAYATVRSSAVYDRGKLVVYHQLAPVTATSSTLSACRPRAKNCIGDPFLHSGSPTYALIGHKMTTLSVDQSPRAFGLDFGTKRKDYLLSLLLCRRHPFLLVHPRRHPFLLVHPSYDQEWNQLPCALTATDHWNPTTLRNEWPKSYEMDYEACYPILGWLPVDVTRRTFCETIYYACLTMSRVFNVRPMSSNSTLNLRLVALVHANLMHSVKPIVNLLADSVHGAMQQSIGNNAETVVAYKVLHSGATMVINCSGLRCIPCIRLAPLDGESINEFVKSRRTSKREYSLDKYQVSLSNLPPSKPFGTCSDHSRASNVLVRGEKSGDFQPVTVVCSMNWSAHRMIGNSTVNDKHYRELDLNSPVRSFALYDALVFDCEWERVPQDILCEPLPCKSDRVPPDIRNTLCLFNDNTAKSLAVTVPTVDSGYGERNVREKALDYENTRTRELIVYICYTAIGLTNRVPPDIFAGGCAIQNCIPNNRVSTAINGPNELSRLNRSLSSYRKANPPDYQSAEQHLSEDKLDAVAFVDISESQIVNESARKCFGDGIGKRKAIDKGVNILLLLMNYLAMFLFTSQCYSPLVLAVILAVLGVSDDDARKLFAVRTTPMYDKQEWWRSTLIATMYLGNLTFDPGGLLSSSSSCPSLPFDSSDHSYCYLRTIRQQAIRQELLSITLVCKVLLWIYPDLQSQSFLYATICFAPIIAKLVFVCIHMGLIVSCSRFGLEKRLELWFSKRTVHCLRFWSYLFIEHQVLIPLSILNDVIVSWLLRFPDDFIIIKYINIDTTCCNHCR